MSFKKKLLQKVTTEKALPLITAFCGGIYMPEALELIHRTSGVNIVASVVAATLLGAAYNIAYWKD